MSTQTVTTIRDGEPRTATSVLLYVHRDHNDYKVEPRTATSVLLYVHRDHNDYKGRGVQDGNLDFHTALKL